MTSDLSEARDSLWWVAVPPAAWALHFVACYATAAVWCAKYAGPESSLWVARWAIGGYTLLALSILGLVARRGWVRYRALGPASELSEGSDSAEARHHFLGFTLLALSALTALAIVFEALAAFFIGSCH